MITLLAIYATSLLVFFLIAALVTWFDKGISGRNFLIVLMWGITPVLNIVASFVIVWIVLRESERVNKFLNSTIFTRK